MAIGRLLFVLARVLLIVRPDDLVGQVRLGRAVEDGRAALLDDQHQPALLADLLDDAGQVLEHALQELLLLLLELLLEVVGQARGVTAVAFERILLVAARLRRHQRPLLLQLVAQHLQLLTLGVHLLLHPRLLALELIAGRDARRGADQDTLDVDERDPGHRRLRPRRWRDRDDEDGRQRQCILQGPHVTLLERRAHREVERAEVLAGLAVRVDPVVDADRPERRLPPDPAADPLLQIRQIELRPEPVHVTDIKEPGEPEAERQRDDVLRVAEHLGRAADSLTGVVFRRDRVELEAPDRVGPAEIEPLEKRQRFIGPAEAIVRLDATAQDVAEPDRVELGRKHSGLHVLRITAESGELRRHVALSALRRRADVVATVAPHSSRHRRGHLDSLLVLELCRQRRDVAEVADPVARRPVAEGPPPVLEERVTQPERGSQRLVAILGVLPRVAVQVESPGEGAIEQPRIREADHPLLCPAATGQTHGDLPATPEEVTLREVDGADEAVHRREAAAEAEDARRALGDLDVDDDLRLVRPWLGGDLDFFEVAEVHELLAGPVLLLQRVEVPLVERDLAAEDLVLAADVAADVDTLDEHLGPLGDVERDVDDVLAGDLLRLGDDVHRCAADGAVEVLDAPEALAQLRPREHVPGLHLQLAPDLLLGEERDPVELDLADLELRSLDDREGDRHARLLTVHGHIGGLDAGLDVAVVVVELNDSLDVLVESLALHLAAEDEVLSLSGRERVLELALREPLVGLEEDPVDLDLTTLDDAEHHANVTVGKLLDVRRHLDLEIPLVLVEVPELLDGALDVYRVVDAAQLDIDLVLELRGLHGLVPGEVDVPDERPFVDDERHLHPALEVLDPHLHVVEEAQAEDRPDVLGEEGRVEGRADGGLDPAEHDGLLDPPRALDRDLLDDDRALLGPLRRGG